MQILLFLFFMGQLYQAYACLSACSTQQERNKKHQPSTNKMKSYVRVSFSAYFKGYPLNLWRLLIFCGGQYCPLIRLFKCKFPAMKHFKDKSICLWHNASKCQEIWVCNLHMFWLLAIRSSYLQSSTFSLSFPLLFFPPFNTLATSTLNLHLVPVLSLATNIWLFEWEQNHFDRWA